MFQSLQIQIFKLVHLSILYMSDLMVQNCKKICLLKIINFSLNDYHTTVINRQAKM